MANSENTPAAGAPSTTITTEIPEERSLSVDAGKADVKEGHAQGHSLDLYEGVGEGLEGEGDGEREPGEAGKTEGEAEGGKPETVEDLGDYSGDDAARAKFDARYLTPGKDGAPAQLNKAVISAEFDANMAKAGADAKDHGYLNEGTYKYLEDTFGVDRTFINDYERGLVALRKEQQTGFFSKIEGGQPAYAAALAWGKAGGYTEAQRERFDALSVKGGADFEDAVEALMVRFKRANPDGFRAVEQRGPGRRRSSPDRTVGGAGGGQQQQREAAPANPRGDVFASREDYQVAWNAGLKARTAAAKTGNNAELRKAERALDDLQAKARRSFRSPQKR